MRLFTFISANLILSTLPLIGLAQSTRTSIASKLMLGLGASYARYSTPSKFAPVLTASLQIKPRLTVQAGASYYWNKRKSYFGTYYDLASNEQHTDVVFTDYDRLLAVPILARYTVTPLASKFNVDILGGATGLFYFGHYTETSTTRTQGTQTTTRDSHNQFTSLLSLGLGLRYALTPQVEIVGDALVNTPWDMNPFRRYSTVPASFTFGARYHFVSH
jgi:hypothetical protein